MKLHELKTHWKPFRDLKDGKKKFEYRRNDRKFQVGDILWLREWFAEKGQYTGAHVVALVTYISEGPDWEIPEGFCVMSIEVIQ